MNSRHSNYVATAKNFPRMSRVIHKDRFEMEGSECTVCMKTVAFFCKETGQEVCSYRCRESLLVDRMYDEERDRIAEITSGGQI